MGGFDFASCQFFRCGVPEHLLHLHIDQLELLAHLICCHLWSHTWYGHKVKGLTDNESCEFFLKFGRSRIDVRLKMARTMSHFEHRLAFKWMPFGVRSKDNVLPDCLSRWFEEDMPDKFHAHLAALDIHDAVQVAVPEAAFDINHRFRSGDPNR